MLRQVLPIVIVAAILIICAVFWPRPEPDSPVDKQGMEGQIRLTQKLFSVPGLDLVGQANGAVLTKFRKQRPDVTVVPATMFRLPGNMWNAQDMLAFAAKNAPDIQYVVFHQAIYYRQQGLLLPLNKWIGDDTNHNGVLDDNEVKWKPFLQYPPAMRRIAMDGPNIYALPTKVYAGGLVYRKDLMAECGVDPRHAPRTWDELWQIGQKLTDPSKPVPGSVENGQYALPSNYGGGEFYSFLYAQGGDLTRGEARLKGQPITTKPLYAFTFDDDPYFDPATRTHYKPGDLTFNYKATFNSEKGKKAITFLRKLRFAPWTRCAQCAAEGKNAPIDLKPDEVKGNYYICATHGKHAFSKDGPDQLIKGIMLPAFSVDNTGDTLKLLRSGKVVMISTYINEQMSIFSPKVIGFSLPPAPDEKSKSIVAGIPTFYGINADITDPQKQQAAWEYLSFKMGPESKAIEARVWAENGYAPYVLPSWLKLAGLDEYLKDVPPDWIEAYHQLDTNVRVIPYCNGWLPLEQELQAFLKECMTQESYAWESRVDEIAKTGNEKYFQALTPTQKRHYTWIVALVCLFIVVMVGGGFSILLRERAKEAAESVSKSQIALRVSRWRKISAWCLLAPALASIALWAYYPLVRGAFLAFQDYHMRGPIVWVGLDNFIEGLITGHFLKALGMTVYFVVLSMGLGFVAPILVALFLSEVPRGKYFFRTIFYLPAVTTGLVITLLWMQFYMPTPDGFLNHLLKPLITWINTVWQGISHDPHAVLLNYPIQWLLNKKTAMLSVVLPAVWAGAGPGSILYLAALKTIPDDIYEAADLDGAGIFAKIRYVTLPYLTPLIMINFIGAFIGCFQNMGNIFLMTGGGPDYQTHVVALEIWMNAYANLRYGVASAQAWMLGSILIGFAVLQMRILNKLNWRRADA
ncbi:MAG: extracellular solute-binding protein [Armatimonadota bacterium]